MAEAIFNALAEDRGLGFRAESAGVAALKGKPIAPNASAALEETGIYTEGHSARQVSAQMLEEADLVLAMSPRHVTELRRVFGDSFAVSTLPEYASGASSEEGISDPYGSAMVAYRASARQLFEYVDLLVNRLAR
jgi:protein-tyrosine-phosphatase